MPDLPDEAVRLARAVHANEVLIRMVLEAAAPAMAEHAARKITAHMNEHEPKARGDLIGGTAAEAQRRRTWRRHFGIAARIAAGAFSTDDDMKREAAAALNRGDFAACYLDEAGNPVAESREDRRRD